MKPRFLSALLASVVLFLSAGRAAETEKQSFNLPAGDAATTLRQLSEAAHREILFSAEIVRGVRTQAVQGEFTALEASNRMLAGTSLQALQEERTGALAVRPRQVASTQSTSAASRPATATESTVARNGTATVRGRVSNSATGQSLEGATVQLAGDVRSTYTERDGTFSLDGVSAGSVAIVVRYPGLDEQTVTAEVASGAVVFKEIKLTATLYSMQPYAVTAIREGNAAAIARQEKSLILVNSISTDAYGNIAKGDLGSFLQRLPGVVGEYGGSAVDGVNVRGLAPEFTTVTMDGNRSASANPGDRSQLVSGMPADFIESVEVIKTPTADMDSDSVGGVVNLRTRSGFDRSGRRIILNASGAYNDTMGRYLDPSGSHKMIFPSVSLDYSDVFTVFGRKLGLAITGNYQEVGDGLDTIRADFNGPWDYKSPTSPRRVQYADQEYHMNKRAGLHGKFDYKLSDTSSLSLTASFTRFRNVMEQDRPGYTNSATLDPSTTADRWVFSRVRYNSNRDFRYTPYDTWQLQANGKHRLGEVQLDWGASWDDSQRPLNRVHAGAVSNNNFTMIYDRTNSKEFPTLTFTGGVPPPNDDFKNMASVNLTASHEDASDKIMSAKLDASRNFRSAWLPIKIKLGAKVRQQERSRDYDELDGTTAAGDYSRYRVFNFTHGWLNGRYPATPLINTWAMFNDAGVSFLPGGAANRPALKFAYNPAVFPNTPATLDASVTNSLLNDWRTRETIPAGYFQSEIALLPNLRSTLGLRYEQTRTSITSRFDKTTGTAEARYGAFRTVDSDYSTWFPNVQFRYEPIHHLTLRANYSTTIGRPRLSDLVGRFTVNDSAATVSFSNPALKPQMSHNYDLSAEYYFEPVGVFSVGVFRKEIRDYVVTRTFTVTGSEYGLNLSQYVGYIGTTRTNTGTGIVKGAEFNYSEQLSFLPGLFRGFGIMGNWTVLTSEGDYNGIVTTKLPIKNTLIGLRPHSGNFGLTYTYGRWDLRLMCNYASAYLSSLNTGDPGSSEFIGERKQWDGFARFNVTRNFNLFVDVINLNRENRGRYQGLYREDRRNQTNLFPRSITGGVQARF